MNIKRAYIFLPSQLCLEFSLAKKHDDAVVETVVGLAVIVDRCSVRHCGQVGSDRTILSVVI